MEVPTSTLTGCLDPVRSRIPSSHEIANINLQEMTSDVAKAHASMPRAISWCDVKHHSLLTQPRTSNLNFLVHKPISKYITFAPT
jgi:hypothetical protein